MTIQRRDFLKHLSVGALAAGIEPSFSSPPNQSTTPPEQKLHPDYQSNNPGTEYFIFGNGKILGALQASPNPDLGTHGGLLVMSSEHFGRKISTYLYHPERGLQNSRFTPIINGRGYLPEFAHSTIRWIYPNGIPTVVLEWEAAGCAVQEESFCPIHDSAIVRTVTLRNNTGSAIDATSAMLLYPNLMYFDEYQVDRVNMTLTAKGYKTMQLFSLNKSTVGDRHMNIPFGEIAPGEEKQITLVFTLDLPREEFERKGLERMREETRKYWAQHGTFETNHAGLNHLFACSKSGLRAAVAQSGKMDGGIWQYNMEWVRDQSMVAVGTAMSGQSDIAEALLRRMISQSVDEDGRTVDSSRHRPPETMELDQNGELLYALWMYWVWTGSDHLIREYWKKIRNVAEYVLQPKFRDPAIGLLKNSREYWERDPAFGVKEGYELAYQTWNIVGLQRAADMALHVGEPGKAKEWTDASALMQKSFLSHPKYSLVDDGRFVKRRLATGEVQRTFEPLNRQSMPKGMPLNVETTSYCDPDAANVLPIMLGVVDAKSPLAAKTLESMEHLWNQRWTTGGYARYDVTSEPDSPGPWPFATMFITRAYCEAGDDAKVWRSLNWLLGVDGGKSGAWLEYYGDRPTPPLPPVGIVVWTWAEIIAFIVHHLLGVRPGPRELVIRPRLLSSLNGAHAKLRVQGHEVELTLKRAAQGQSALVDGTAVKLKNGTLTLPLPRKSMTIIITL